MALNIWRWYGDEGEVEDSSVVVAVCDGAQAAWEALRAFGVESEAATSAVRFMPHADYGRPVSGKNGETFRVTEATWLDEKFKRYADGVRP